MQQDSPFSPPASSANPRASLEYPALLGSLGGGQLARMTAEAATRLGGGVGGGWLDFARLAELAEGELAVTLENEFVDVAALEWLEARGVAVYPSARTLALIQDKYEQKRFMRAAGIPTSDFAPVAAAEDVSRAAGD